MIVAMKRDDVNITEQYIVMTVWPVIQTCVGVSRALATPPCIMATQLRWAGHNKWSNIRHIKAEKDGLAAKVSC